MDPNITRVLDRLRSKLGLGETPLGSNYNEIVQWYNTEVDQIGRGPWCEMTTTWAMWTGGAKSLKTGRAYTVWAAQDALAGKNGSTWHYGTQGMRAGDQVYYDWSQKKGNVIYVDHTGFAEKINGDGSFYTLEGNNVNNKLERMLRDGKYVVGYVRFDWSRLPQPVVKPADPKPVPNTSKVDPKFVARMQNLLGVNDDGQWGPMTDDRAQRLRSACRAHLGYPKNVPAKFAITDVQRVIGTKADAIWGPDSQGKLASWLSKFQGVLAVERDSKWGPATDASYLKRRSENLNKF